MCVLVDMKANIDDVDKTFDDILNNMQITYAPKNAVDSLL